MEIEPKIYGRPAISLTTIVTELPASSEGEVGLLIKHSFEGVLFRESIFVDG
jgi:hypothetical protein